MADRPADGGRGAGADPHRAGRVTTSSAGAARPHPPGPARARHAGALAHESFDGALVVKTLGLSAGRAGPLAAAATGCATSVSASATCGRLRARCSTPSRASAPSPCWASGRGGSRRGRSPRASWSRPWPCSPSSPFRCGCSASSSSPLPRAVVSVDRLDEVIATEPAPIPDPSVRTGLPPPGPSGSRSPTWASPTPGPSRADDLRSRSVPARSWPSTGATGVGQEHALLPARPPHGPVAGSASRSAAST